MGGGEISVWGRVLTLGSIYVVHWTVYTTPSNLDFPGFRLGSPNWIAVGAQSWVDEGASPGWMYKPNVNISMGVRAPIVGG